MGNELIVYSVRKVGGGGGAPSIYLDGSNASSISARIPFPLGISLPSGTDTDLALNLKTGGVTYQTGFYYSATNELMVRAQGPNGTVLDLLKFAAVGNIFFTDDPVVTFYSDILPPTAGTLRVGSSVLPFSLVSAEYFLVYDTTPTIRLAPSGGANTYIVTTNASSEFRITNESDGRVDFLIGGAGAITMGVAGQVTTISGNAVVIGSTTLATSLTGVLKGTSGLVAVASSSDILAAIDFGTVMLKTDAGATTYYKPSADTDAARGTALATAIAAHAAGDTIIVGPGTYDLTDDFTLLAGASLIGVGQPKLYCDDLTDKPLVRLINNNVRVENIDLETNLCGLGEYSNTPLNISGIILRNVRHTPTTTTNVDGISFFSSGVTTEHVVSLDAYHCKFYGGTTLGFGSRMTMATGSVINFWYCDVYGATDGVANGSPTGTQTPVTNIYGGKYASVLDAITSQGTGAIINVYGATARGDQADIYGDDGTVNVYWSDYRTEYIVGNGVVLTNVHNDTGHRNIISGDLTFSDFGGAADAGISRLSAGVLQITNGGATRADLEVADEAYHATNWNGSFEVPTKNAIRDQIELMPTLAAANTLTGANTFNNVVKIKASAFTSHVSSYELSVQSNTTTTYIEILNSSGTGKGAFFGLETNDFALYNYQGQAAVSGNYPTIFYGGWGAPVLLSLDRAGGTLFNTTNIDVDFRIAGDTLTHAFFLDASAATENIALITTAAPNWQSMDRGLFIGEATTIPTGNPTGGGFAYVEGGAFKWRSPAGTITVMGAA